VIKTHKVPISCVYCQHHFHRNKNKFNGNFTNAQWDKLIGPQHWAACVPLR